MESQLRKILKKLETMEKRLLDLENSQTNSQTNSKTIRIKQKTETKENSKNISIKSGNIIITKHPNGCIVTGDTFDKRSIIKKYKGWWTPEVKGWTIKLNNYDTIKSDLEKSSKTLLEETSDERLDILESKKVNTPGVENVGFVYDSE